MHDGNLSTALCEASNLFNWCLGGVMQLMAIEEWMTELIHSCKTKIDKIIVLV